MKTTRRQFLVAAGAAGAAGAAAAIPGLHQLERGHVIYTHPGENPALENQVLTFCQQCPGGCGIAVRVTEGRAVGVAGNPYHPISRGGVCAKGAACLQSLYDPDRLRGPLRRQGPRGSAAFESIGWQNGLSELREKLRDIRERSEPHRLAVMLGPVSRLHRAVWHRFARGFGSPNLIDCSEDFAGTGPAAIRAMQGLQQPPGYDLASTSYVLSFGSLWLENFWSPVQAFRAWGDLRRRKAGSRPRVVHVGPRLSETAAKADEWVPVRPGLEGALALGIAHVIVREGLYDHDFVRNYTSGFHDWTDDHGQTHIGLRTLLLRDYDPGRVAGITGVREETIFRLAREFTAHRPALALGFDGGGPGMQRTYDRMAVHALNALVGSFEQSGGVLVADLFRLGLDQAVAPDASANQGLAKPRIDRPDPQQFGLGSSSIKRLAERIRSGRPYPLSMLVFAGANPVYDSPFGADLAEAIQQAPKELTVVSLSSVLDESTQQADLILPSHTFLERWDLDTSHTLEGHAVASLGRPVVEPVYDTRDPVELLLELAKQLGGSLAQGLPFDSTEEAIRADMEGLYQSGRGGPVGPPSKQAWVRLLERGGWQASYPKTFEDFWSSFQQSGGWADPVYFYGEWDRVFRNEAMKFSFYSPVLAAGDKTSAGPNGDLAAMPHFDPVLGSEASQPREGYPLTLHVYELPVLSRLSDPNHADLRDIAGSHMLQRWDSWVEINPATAERLGVANGELVWIESMRGKLRLRAAVFAGIRPDVVAAPVGLGRTCRGRWCDQVGKNITAVVEPVADSVTGKPYWNATRVRVYKA